MESHFLLIYILIKQRYEDPFLSIKSLNNNGNESTDIATCLLLDIDVFPDNFLIICFQDCCPFAFEEIRGSLS